jgi:ComF family protein
MVYKWLNRLQYALFPLRCQLCGAPGDRGQDLCGGCRAELPWASTGCARCAAPLPAAAMGRHCARCQQSPPHFDRVLAPFRYAPPLDHLILRLKFQRDLAQARLLGELLAGHLRDRQAEGADAWPDILLPVPLHRRRLAERGFNQSLELGRTLQRLLPLRLDYRLARRVKHTDTQSLLPARQRVRNLRDAFVLDDRPLPAHVALLDDVMTTGATVNELARLLKRAGVARVDVWVLARVARS